MKKISKVLSAVLVLGLLSGCGHSGTKHSIYFETGSAKLTKAGKNSLKRIAKYVESKDRFIRGEDGKLSEPKNIHLTGYTDNVGSKKINKKLSDHRVLAVKKELMRLGIRPMFITSASRGEGWLEKKGNSDQKKRRVDISVY